MSAKERLVDATILLRCVNNKHICKNLRDALSNVDGVTEAFCTGEQISGIEFCVGGTIVATSRRLEQIKREVHQLKNKNKIIGVEKTAMVIAV